MSERFREASLPAPRLVRAFLGLWWVVGAFLLVHATRGEFAALLLVDAAAVAFVRLHGAVPLAWARARPS